MTTMATYTSTNATGSTNDTNLNADPSSVPSGFVLKLYQMVNEAPEDIVSVSIHKWDFLFVISSVESFLYRNFHEREHGTRSYKNIVKSTTKSNFDIRNKIGVL